MLGINLKHTIAILAVTAGVLGAEDRERREPRPLQRPRRPRRGVIDGTSNTIMFAAKNEVSVDRVLPPEVNDEVL